ncbi:MAG: hypothetical protein WD068_00230 [Candidatus Babeliales bacterium]
MEQKKGTSLHTILQYVAGIPKKMVSVHGITNVPEFVLHELCHDGCFNIPRAAYFVDNPDFDHLKGVAGYNSTEGYMEHATMWQDPETFSLYMRSCPFNQAVRSCGRKSIRNNGSLTESVVEEIATDLGFNRPEILEWRLKHDNHGLLIYDSSDALADLREHLEHSLYLLSFCPIF